MINKKSQQGATLIVVLIVVLLVIIIGTLAIRQSLLSLNIATNGQAQQLMLQSSDAPLVKIQDPVYLSFNLTQNGVIGYALDHIGKEVVFCFRGTQSTFFDISKISLMKWQSGQTSPNGTELGTQGYCSVSTSVNNYTSGRQAVMTQITVLVPDDTQLNNNTTPFENMLIGTDSQVVQLKESKTVIVHTVSFMPALSQASATSINNCLSGRVSTIPTNQTGQTVSQCLAALNVPYSTQVIQYNSTKSITST
ncbi:PilX N-terminal domain-containing pilus assembly protein [Acinetobacter brisouii]|uniref:PilX N-terminal domain-containing pilus assembly protein n=1 Tax=Acinetobacter brisouii TaxID=396323 RepID=UPI00124F5BE3|nr:PilX N-terminal domain-containing pilus assembly protein [Acinetobacter brisouii]